MRFFTEASLDLAEDPELLHLMVEANFGAVFIGIESPNEASLRETKKIQNLRRGKTLAERIHTIQKAAPTRVSQASRPTAAAATGPALAVSLYDQVRDALPPLHDGSNDDYRELSSGQFVLVSGL